LRSPLYSGLLDLQVGDGLRLDRELVGEAVALGLPSFVVRGAELGDRRLLKVMARIERRWGRREKVHELRADHACRGPERQLL